MLLCDNGPVTMYVQYWVMRLFPVLLCVVVDPPTTGNVHIRM